MHKQLIQLAALSLVLVPAIQAGIVVNDPDISGAIIDPAGSTTVDINHSSGTYTPITFNALANLRVLSFDQAAFTVGQTLDQVNFTTGANDTPINTLTFSGLQIAGNYYNATSGNNSLVVTTATQNTVSASIKFSTPVEKVGFTVSNLNMGGLDVQFYDAVGTPLYHTNQFNAASGDPNSCSANDGSMDNFYSPLYPISANIAEIRLVPLHTSGMLISLDDLAFTQVPEPASLGLLALGALALARRRRG
ncbi:MAG: PEP-CTERM sorting domain-containing protein [Lentisphaeria bacterium]